MEYLEVNCTFIFSITLLIIEKMEIVSISISEKQSTITYMVDFSWSKRVLGGSRNHYVMLTGHKRQVLRGTWILLTHII